MRTHTVTQREGTAVGPVDWSHPTARDMPPIWREAEANPDAFVLVSNFAARPILSLCMYDGWPYWTPRPAILFYGTLGPEWAWFDSYGVHADSIQPRWPIGWADQAERDAAALADTDPAPKGEAR